MTGVYDAVAMGIWYVDAANKGKLWKPSGGVGGTVSTTEMPRMWLFPAFMWKVLASGSGDKTCNDTLHHVNAVTQEQNPFVTAEAAEDMRDWLMLVGQCNQAERKSLLAMTVEFC